VLGLNDAGARLVSQEELPEQKLDLVLNLPEGRGLVVKRGEEVKRGESLLAIPDATLITVERAVAQSKLGPKHAALQEWSLLAAFLAEQALAVEAGSAVIENKHSTNIESPILLRASV
jgi:hypothetical protein